MKRFFLLTTIALSLLSTLPLRSENGLNIKIVRGGQDTVYNSSHYLIGVAEPGTEVKINNQLVKVYKTGSFGIHLQLSEGNNPVSISAVRGSERAVIDHNIYYSTAPAPQRPVAIIEPIDTSFYVVSRDDAWLNYANGTDRLGGAKISMLAGGVTMEVKEIYGDLYKVALSEKRHAYIPKSLCEETKEAPVQSLTGSWYVSNIGNHDKVSISLSTKLPYTIDDKAYPSRIEVDIYGAKCNSNWITQMLDTKMVKSVDFEQVDSDVFRVIIYLQKEHGWGYHVKYENNNLAIYVKHEPDLALKGMTIGLDAGHGGPAPGAISPSGLREKDLNLDMVYTLKKMLEKEGAKVVLSRTDDSDISQAERKAFFISNSVDMALSIHCNASGNPLIHMGASTYYKQFNDRDFAKCVLERMLKLGMPNYGLVGNFNFSQNAVTHYPNILVETLFMSSLPDEELLADPKFREQMMKEVVSGIKDYLKLCRSK